MGMPSTPQFFQYVLKIQSAPKLNFIVVRFWDYFILFVSRLYQQTIKFSRIMEKSLILFAYTKQIGYFVNNKAVSDARRRCAKAGRIALNSALLISIYNTALIFFFHFVHFLNFINGYADVIQRGT
jgi:hypothetical protein